MKWIFVLASVVITTALAGEPVEQVKGLFYFDGSPVAIDIAEGQITRINRLDADEAADMNMYVAPGFIDIQINGYAAVDFSGEDLTVDGVRRATEALWKAGVTTYFPTIITNSDARIKCNFAILAQASKDPEMGRSIPGFHLEGPYISPEDGFRGAHLKEYVRQPDWEQFASYVRAAEGKILFHTLAPEIEGSVALTERAVAHGIVIAIGHTGANTEQIKAVVDAGASISTHLGNGCANMIHRHHNPLWPQLADDRLSPTLIVDGHHLLPEEVQTFYKVKGPENVMLISDALDLAGMPPGEYMAGGKKVVMTPDGTIKYPEQNVLAGASLPIGRGVQNVMNYTQCSLADAIHMATRNQARHFGLEQVGEIVPGKRADLVLFTLKDGELTVQQTILAGEVVYTRE